MAPRRSTPRNRARILSPRPYRQTRSMLRAEATSAELSGLQSVSLEDRDEPMLHTTVAAKEQESHVLNAKAPKKAKRSSERVRLKKTFDIKIRPHGYDTALPEGEIPGTGSHVGAHDVRTADPESHQTTGLHDKIVAAQSTKGEVATAAAEEQISATGVPASKTSKRTKAPRKGKAAKAVQDKDGDADMADTTLPQVVNGTSPQGDNKERKTRPKIVKVRTIRPGIWDEHMRHNIFHELSYRSRNLAYSS